MSCPRAFSSYIMYSSRQILHKYQTRSAMAAVLECFASPMTVSVLQALTPPETKLNPTYHKHYQTRSALAARPECHASPHASRNQTEPSIRESDTPDEGLAERRHKYFRGLLLYNPLLFPPYYDSFLCLINTQRSSSSSIQPLLA